MKTFEYSFTAPSSDIQHDMLITMLAEIGFDSFMDEERCLKAYCSEANRNDLAVEALLNEPSFSDIRLLNVEEMPDKDWNELWEASYQPVVVNISCWMSDDGAVKVYSNVFILRQCVRLGRRWKRSRLP